MTTASPSSSVIFKNIFLAAVGILYFLRTDYFEMEPHYVSLVGLEVALDWADFELVPVCPLHPGTGITFPTLYPVPQGCCFVCLFV